MNTNDNDTKLALRRQSIRDLTASELSVANGGKEAGSSLCLPPTTVDKKTHPFSLACHFPTWNA